ncbi:MAG: hypothetical protein JNJ61_15610, partial [Anaerolineae bacterium]|nr:hypothetical protein [Anaerolineae bacterium]
EEKGNGSEKHEVGKVRHDAFAPYVNACDTLTAYPLRRCQRHTMHCQTLPFAAAQDSTIPLCFSVPLR